MKTSQPMHVTPLLTGKVPVRQHIASLSYVAALALAILAFYRLLPEQFSISAAQATPWFYLNCLALIFVIVGRCLHQRPMLLVEVDVPDIDQFDVTDVRVRCWRGIKFHTKRQVTLLVPLLESM